MPSLEPPFKLVRGRRIADVLDPFDVTFSKTQGVHDLASLLHGVVMTSREMEARFDLPVKVNFLNDTTLIRDRIASSLKSMKSVKVSAKAVMLYRTFSTSDIDPNRPAFVFVNDSSDEDNSDEDDNETVHPRDFRYCFHIHVHVINPIRVTPVSHLRMTLGDLLQSCDDAIENTPSMEFVGFLSIQFQVANYNPINGGSYLATPIALRNGKQGITNPNNEASGNNRCLWYTLAIGRLKWLESSDPSRKKVGHLDRQTVLDKLLVAMEPTIKNVLRLDLDDVVSDDRFQDICDAFDVGIAVWSCRVDAPDGKIAIKPYWTSKGVAKMSITRDRCVVMMLRLYDDERAHFVYVSNASALLGQFLSGHNSTERHICLECTAYFTEEKHRDDHVKRGCIEDGSVTHTMPEKGVFNFVNFQNMHLKDWFVASDAECKMVLDKNDKMIHQLSRIGRAVYSTRDPKLLDIVIFDNINDYISCIVKDAQRFCGMMNASIGHDNIVMSTKQKMEHAQATTCYMCKRPFDKKAKKIAKKGTISDGQKVRDHDHLVADDKCNYRGAACHRCNLRARNDRYILDVLFHNGGGYDFNILIEALCRFQQENPKLNLKIEPLARTSNRFIAINVSGIVELSPFKFCFKDSMGFIDASLDKIVETHAKGGRTFDHMKAHFKEHSTLLCRKGVYPYEIQGDLRLITDYPPIEVFYSSLTGQTVSNVDYEWGKHVWTTMRCHNMRDYEKIYLETDILQLLDAFAAFRLEAHANFGIDPLHSYTLPGTAYDAMKRQHSLDPNAVVVELLGEKRMYDFFRQGKRGGIAVIDRRHAKANNPRCPDYDPSSPTTWIVYIDYNSLYPSAMRRPMPNGDFKWVTCEDFKFKSTKLKKDGKTTTDKWRKEVGDFVMSLAEDSPMGYTFCIDTEVPDHLHDYLQQSPPLPETLEVDPSMVSPYNQRAGDNCDLKSFKSVKLVPHLRGSKNYIVHYSALKHALELGVVITDIHESISFKQSAWLKPFVEKCAKLRGDADRQGNSVTSNLCKLMMNASYGKLDPNPDNRLNVTVMGYDALNADDTRLGVKGQHIMTRKRLLLRQINKTSYRGAHLVNEDVVMVMQKQLRVSHNDPTPASQAIMDISKMLVARQFYRVLEHYGSGKVIKLGQDTDSYLMLIETDDIFADYAKADGPWSGRMDFSKFPEDHPLFDRSMASKPDYWKDEGQGQTIVEFCGIAPKCYALTWADDDAKAVETAAMGTTVTKCKGLARTARGALTMAMYKDVLATGQPKSFKQSRIMAHDFQLSTTHQVKRGLNAMDTKVWVMDDGITTLPHGHCRLKDMVAVRD